MKLEAADKLINLLTELNNIEQEGIENIQDLQDIKAIKDRLRVLISRATLDNFMKVPELPKELERADSEQLDIFKTQLTGGIK